MKALEILFNRRWVLKSEDKDLYYQIRDAVGEVRKYTTEKLGCQIIDNSMLVKMEKIPVIPETFMGDSVIYIERGICVFMHTTYVFGR